ncbi:MAG: hypothetical protein PHO41_06395, partial [Eubacteriales bacterium]|nr:hypothetical protein [Eubacteriales bacterium]
MKKYKSAKRMITLLLAAAFTAAGLCGCVSQPSATEIKKPEPTSTPIPYEELFAGTPEETPDLTPEEVYSAWIPYWDSADAIQEVGSCSELVRDIIPFAVIIDSNGKPYFLEEMEQTVVQVIEKFGDSKNIFLSFTNDVIQDNGAVVQKDLDILRRILKDEASIDKNIDQLLAACAEYDIDGIEIDYENLDKFDEDMMSQYLLFIERLYARTRKVGLRLRVVVGVYPVTYATFPKGPEYVVMCYNLFGFHSGPGPKANKAFLSTSYASNQALPGKVSMA